MSDEKQGFTARRVVKVSDLLGASLGADHDAAIITDNVSEVVEALLHKGCDVRHLDVIVTPAIMADEDGKDELVLAIMGKAPLKGGA